MKPIQAVNDFVIRFANVNGTGSASANNLFAKAIYRLGVPVSPKNIFPSNIQGLPTWYEVRVSGEGYLGRRGGVDMVVAINGQTLKQDYETLLPGGYFIYDSTKPLPPDFTRDDIVVIGIPLTELVNANFSDPRQRQLFKNIIYVGALASLLDIGLEVFFQSIERQFVKKPKLIAPNHHALQLGYDYAAKHYADVCQIRVVPLDKVGNKIMMDGNTATALGAIYGGATVAAWYPITPSTSVVDAFEKYCRQLRIDPDTGKHRFAIVQAEDELAAMGMVMGATWMGARAFTATSGPGVSLMSEFLGLGYFAEIPAVLIDVQRVGPSTGMPTRTQQGDLLLAAYASHGDTKHPFLLPATPTECFEMTALSFDLADRLQTPVIVLSDLDLGMNDHLCEPLQWDDQRQYDRGKVLDAEALRELKQPWGRYQDVDGDGIGYRTLPATDPEKGMYFTRGSSHDEFARYTEDSDAYQRSMERLARKWETAKTLMPAPEIVERNARIGVVYFGTTTDAAREAMAKLAERGVMLDEMRLRAFPFSDDVRAFIENHEQVFVIEQNRDAQMRTLLVNELGVSPSHLTPILHYNGQPITASFIQEALEAAMAVATEDKQRTEVVQ